MSMGMLWRRGDERVSMRRVWLVRVLRNEQKSESEALFIELLGYKDNNIKIG